MGLFEVIVQTTYRGVLCVNRWNYRSSGTPAAITPSFALASAMGFILGQGDSDFPDDSIGGVWQAQVSNELKFNQVQVKNIYNPLDFYLTPFGGNVEGDGASQLGSAPFLAFGVTTNRTRLDIRSGSKRFAGVHEGQIEGGGALSASALVGLQNLCDEMSATLQYDDEGNILDFAPVIVSKEKYTTPSGKDAYRYYADEATQLLNVMDSFLYKPMPFIRHQVSRQYGRGQ